MPSRYTPPPPAAVRALPGAHGLTRAQAAELAGLASDNQWRKYTGGEHPRKMREATWFMLHARLLLDAEQIARIEAAMTAAGSRYVETDK